MNEFLTVTLIVIAVNTAQWFLQNKNIQLFSEDKGVAGVIPSAKTKDFCFNIHGKPPKLELFPVFFWGIFLFGNALADFQTVF